MLQREVHEQSPENAICVFTKSSVTTQPNERLLGARHRWRLRVQQGAGALVGAADGTRTLRAPGTGPAPHSLRFEANSIPLL